ncbi:MAG TPA: alpha/beta fold hydrolase [Ktedonobacteraceae bacterium]
MNRDDTFSDNGAPPTPAPEHGGDSEGYGLSSPPTTVQDTLSSAHLPRIERRLTSHHRMRLLLVAMVVVVLVALAGGYGVFRAVSQHSRQASSAFQVIHCPFALGAALVEGQNVRCGFLSVPEDRSHMQGPTIRLAVAIFKTPSSHPAPDPVLVLGGGPGDALLERMGPTYNAGNLLSNRDLILLDQRGAGYSQPSLRCFVNETPRACHDRLVKSGINLNAYTTLENAADVHDLIQTLGYRQVNLEGASYGTRLALTVMRLYPADLRSVVLKAVLPPQVNALTSLPQATIRAFDVLFRGCSADSSCNATYPHLQAVFYQLVANLNTTPISFKIALQTGASVTVHFTGNDLVLWLRQSLYAAGYIPQLPAVIFQIRQHDYAQLASIYGNFIDDTMSWGLFYSVICGEDAAFTTRQALKISVQGLPPQAQHALLDLSMSLFSVCQFWGMSPVPVVQKEPVRSTIPTLILQGEYDPATPPANGMLAAQTLSRSYFFLLPGVGHFIHSPTSTCPDTIPEAFRDHPTEKPDTSCINSMFEPVFT